MFGGLGGWLNAYQPMIVMETTKEMARSVLRYCMMVSWIPLAEYTDYPTRGEGIKAIEKAPTGAALFGSLQRRDRWGRTSFSQIIKR